MLRILFAFAQATACAAAFVGCNARLSVPPRSAIRAVATPDSAIPDSEKAGMGIFGSGRPEGVHGTGYRFMPMSTMTKDSSPVLLLIAGVYPGMTADQFLAPQPLPFPSPGKWNYHRLTGDVAPSGFVVLPGSTLLDDHPNSVAVVCSSEGLGLELPDGQVHEVIAVLDRSDEATTDASTFDSSKFYAFADTESQVHIRWMQAVPEGWAILGRLLYAQLPFVKKPGQSGSFAETSDDFEF